MSRLKAKRMRHSTFGDSLMTFLLWFMPIGCIVAFILAQNNLVLSSGTIFEDREMPKSFVGYSVVNISDIDNSSIDIAKKVAKIKPDVILLTGGYSDADGNYSNTVATVSKLAAIAPTYCVYQPDDTVGCLDSTGAINLTDEIIKLEPEALDVNAFIEKNYGKDIIKQAEAGDETATEYIEYVSNELTESQSKSMSLLGIGNYYDENNPDSTKEVVNAMMVKDGATYRIGLLGDLSTADSLKGTGLNLIFAGGTHGVADESSEYSKGSYGIGNITLLLSSGIGKPDGSKTRFMNLPEIQYIILSDGTISTDNPLEKLLNKLFKGVDIATIFDNDGGFTEYTYEFNGKDKKEIKK